MKSDGRKKVDKSEREAWFLAQEIGQDLLPALIVFFGPSMEELAAVSSG